MHINGQPVTSSGAIIICPGETGTLTLPFGTFDLEFRPTMQPQSTSLNLSPPRIVIDGSDNALGCATSIVAPTATGSNVILRMVIYAIGTDPQVVRLVHYTTT